MLRPPLPTARASAQSLRVGDAVVCPDGSVGVLYRLEIFQQSTVQFGAAGPTRFYSWKDLRVATGAEILDAGLDGVGCNQHVDVVQERRQRVKAHKRA